MVVLTVKNLQHESFSIDIDMSLTVKELKEKIEKEKGSDYPASGQKLIYAGKILQDASILDTYNIDESKFLVVLVTKPKVTAAPTEAAEEEPEEATGQDEQPATTSSIEQTTTATTTTSSASNTSTTATSQSSPATTPSAGSQDTAESLVVMGEEFNKMVDNIMEMGYERPQVERALRASFNNPYTAVTYLVDGIPPNLADDPTGAAVVDPAIGGGQAADEEAEAEAQDADDPLSFLRSQPQFTQMRQMIRSNPQLLDAFIQQIGQTNPELLEVIQQNQEAFVRMLNEGPAGAVRSSGSTPSSGGGGGGTGGGGGGGGGGGTGGGNGRSGGQSNYITVSLSDRNAIDRLKSLGNFPEDVVVQAYFACEKNENLAAEFLFSQTWD